MVRLVALRCEYGWSRVDTRQKDVGTPRPRGRCRWGQIAAEAAASINRFISPPNNMGSAAPVCAIARTISTSTTWDPPRGYPRALWQ